MKYLRLENACKRYKIRSGHKVILDHASLNIREGEKIGVIGQNGAGKSTLLKILGGVEYLNSGIFSSNMSISWPIGFSGGFQGSLTGRDNVAFLARIYGIEEKWLLERVEDFAELGPYINMPVRTYSSGMRARLAFGVSLQISFDCYLIDEIISVGDARFQEKSRRNFIEMQGGKTVVVVSHDRNILSEYCKSGIFLDRGQISYYEDINDAIAKHM